MFTDVHDRLIAITGVGRQSHIGETAAKNEALSLMRTVALDEPHGDQRGRHGGPGRRRRAGERGGRGGVSAYHSNPLSTVSPCQPSKTPNLHRSLSIHAVTVQSAKPRCRRKKFAGCLTIVTHVNYLGTKGVWCLPVSRARIALPYRSRQLADLLLLGHFPRRIVSLALHYARPSGRLKRCEISSNRVVSSRKRNFSSRAPGSYVIRCAGLLLIIVFTGKK
jgi:hypothetical protein